MIEFSGKPGDLACKIRFSPRPGFKKDKSAAAFELDLLYGHRCPTCGNVIQALFLTDEPIDLWKYEETAVISQSTNADKFGTILKYIPNDESKEGYSQYISTFYSEPAERAQHLVLKNHILDYHGLNNPGKKGENVFGPGGHVCSNTGTFSRKEELAIRDMALFWKTQPSNLMKWKIPSSIDLFVTSLYASTYGLRALPAYGQAPPVLLFPRGKVVTEINNEYLVRQMLAQFQPEERTT